MIKSNFYEKLVFKKATSLVSIYNQVYWLTSILLLRVNHPGLRLHFRDEAPVTDITVITMFLILIIIIITHSPYFPSHTDQESHCLACARYQWMLISPSSEKLLQVQLMMSHITLPHRPCPLVTLSTRVSMARTMVRVFSLHRLTVNQRLLQRTNKIFANEYPYTIFFHDDVILNEIRVMCL